jgi:hypothetical protein
LCCVFGSVVAAGIGIHRAHSGRCHDRRESRERQ